MPELTRHLRFVFMGTPELAESILAALLEQPALTCLAVVTQPDRPRGRELKLAPSPVKRLALQHHLPLLQAAKARDPLFIQRLADMGPDLIIVAAFGQLLPPAILDLPPLGCLNVHTSLLPKYRGAAPIQWALLNGETETGVTIMRMDAGMDTGPILSQSVLPILPEDNSQILHDRLAIAGANLLLATVPDWAAQRIVPSPQNNRQASYAPRITKEHGRIVWTKPARQIWNQIRAFTPWPGAYTTLPTAEGPRLLKIWQAGVVNAPIGSPGCVLKADASGIFVGCGENSLQILSLQREGKRQLSAAQFLLGNPLGPNLHLGESAP